jgi:GNAT superfamily N-acetyltransferase
MEIIDFDHLPRDLLPQLGSLGLLNGDTPLGIDFVQFLRRFRTGALPQAEYYAVYAVEDGTILSRVEVTRPRFTTEDAPQTVAGIADVSTRPDAVRRGLAGKLLEEVHRREAELGYHWAILWTRRSWGAHRLYERLGYRDVHSPASALRPLPHRRRRRLPKGYTWVPAQRQDAARIERLFAGATRGRLGFVPRPRGSIALKFELGWRVPENHRILSYRGLPVGYAYLNVSPFHVGTSEVLVEAPEHAGPMIEALEATAKGGSFSLANTTFIRDAEQEFRRRGYAIYPSAHLTLMAKSLASDGRTPEDLEVVCRDRRFSCHRGDVF